MIDCAKRLVEVDEVLSYLNKKDFEKIPKDIIDMIRENKDTEYKWLYDKTKPLKEQNLNRNTIIILSYINTTFLLNEEQKRLMDEIHRLNEKKRIIESNSKYNYDDLFEKNKKITEEIETNNISKVALVEYKENIFVRIINMIKSFLKGKL